MKENAVDFVPMIFIGAMCAITACSDENFDEAGVEEITESSHWQRADINLHVDCINFDAQTGVTRFVDEGWKDGDRIYLILKDKDGNNVQAYVEYDGAATSWGQVEYDGYKSSLTCTTPRTIEAYYFDGAMDVTSSDITFDATTGVYVCTDGIYTYPDNGNLEVSISLAPLTSRIRFTGESGTNFSLSGMTTYTTFSRVTGELTSTLESVSTLVDTTGTTPYIYGVFASPEVPSLVVRNNRSMFETVFDASTNVLKVGMSGYMPIPTKESHNGWKQQFIPATGISLNRNSLLLNKGDSIALKVSITPTNTTENILWASSDTSIVKVSDSGIVSAIGCGVAIITVSIKGNLDITDSCTIEIKQDEEIEVEAFDSNGHAYVDLGLTSGTLWATMNVGASSSEDYGDYFAWGEVNGYDCGKKFFTMETYKYCNGEKKSMTKYCTDGSYGNVDNKTELDLSDDVARHNWGGSWRMPSKEQFEELYNECTWTWTSQDRIYGYRVSSKKNTNSIFFPAAGYRLNDLESTGSKGYYWSRSLDVQMNNSRAYCRYFNSNVNSYSYSYRNYGNSVRPVLSTK